MQMQIFCQLLATFRLFQDLQQYFPLKTGTKWVDLKVCFHATVTVRRYRHRRDQITARQFISTPPSPLAVRTSGATALQTARGNGCYLQAGERAA